MKRCILIVAALCCLPITAYAQLWSGILSSNRAADWTLAGVKGDIPSSSWTQCGSTIPAGSSAATIQSAINACGTNQYVQLGAGTFTLSAGLQMKSNVVLRGMGADQTFIVGNGTIGCGFGANAVVQFCVSSGTVNSANWTSGYSKGSTQIVVSSTTGLVVGSMMFLDQLDDSSDGWPSAGDTYICQVSSATCAAGSGGGIDSRSGRAQTELHEVTNIAGTTITITPPISNPNWRSGQSPGAYWMSPNSDVIVNSGVENLSIDWTNVQNSDYNTGIAFGFAKDCWALGTRVIDTSTNQHILIEPIFLSRSMRVTLRSNYIFGPSINPTSVFQIAAVNSGSLLIENNIIQNGNQPIFSNGSLSNSVISYNYAIGTVNAGNPGLFTTHGAGEMMNLVEGNYGPQFVADSIHGTHDFQTVFRNYFHGMGPSVFARMPFYMESYARLVNAVGNVLGNTASSFNAYEANMTYNNNAIYNLGWSAAPGGGEVQVNPDSHVKTSMMRWGNWDNVTGTRWCGNSSDTGWSTTCSSTSEVPTGLTNFSNAVPTKGDQGIGQPSMPPSFYLASKPSWFPLSKPWPPIGPDVTGGDVAAVAGHIYSIPARDCYLVTMGGPSDGSGNPLSFNASTCYPAQSTPPAPSNTKITTFPLTENPISEGDNWINGGTCTPPDICGVDWNNIATTGGSPGIAFGTENGSGGYTDSTAILTGSWGEDQTVQVKVKVATGNTASNEEVEIRLRSALSAHSSTGYEVECSIKSGNPYIVIVRWNGALGDFTELASTTTGSDYCPDGSVFKASMVGNTITAYLNGTQKLQTTDSVYSTGNPGIGFGFYLGGGSGSNSDYGINNFVATDGSSSAVLYPLTWTFANQPVSTTSSPKVISFTNIGSSTINISSIALTTHTQFAVSANTCTSTLTAGSNCLVSVTFTPTSTGSLSDTLVFTTDATSNPDSIPVSGNGVAINSFATNGTSIQKGASIR